MQDQNENPGVSGGSGSSPVDPMPADWRDRMRELAAEQRMKTWDECTPDERIERLREQLRTKEMAIGELRQQIDLLMRHQHGAHGELLQPLYGYSQGMVCGPRCDPLA